MNGAAMKNLKDTYFTDPERRLATHPRRTDSDRRYRKRSESLVSDCRESNSRRKEDEEGFIEISDLYIDDENTEPQPHKLK